MKRKKNNQIFWIVWLLNDNNNIQIKCSFCFFLKIEKRDQRSAEELSLFHSVPRCHKIERKWKRQRKNRQHLQSAFICNIQTVFLLQNISVARFMHVYMVHGKHCKRNMQIIWSYLFCNIHHGPYPAYLCVCITFLMYNSLKWVHTFFPFSGRFFFHKHEHIIFSRNITYEAVVLSSLTNLSSIAMKAYKIHKFLFIIFVVVVVQQYLQLNGKIIFRSPVSCWLVIDRAHHYFGSDYSHSHLCNLRPYACVRKYIEPTAKCIVYFCSGPLEKIPDWTIMNACAM